MVNLGWSPQASLCGIDYNIVSVTALYREANRPNSFITDNDPANNIWYWPEIEAIEAYTGHMMEDGMFYAEQALSPHITPRAGRPELRNDHLQYAIFWYFMAFVLAVITTLKVRQSMTTDVKG